MINGIKKTLNWSYERGSWQYDLLCLLIIAVIFLVPGRLFSERDRGGLAASTAPIPVEIGEITQIEVEEERLKQFLERNQRPTLVEFPVEALGFYLREQYNRPVRILRYDQYLDTEKRVWYRVSFSLG
jgi:hypothetical protein